MNSRGATTVKGLNLASTNISGPSSVQRDRREYGQACADVERNNHRIISRDSSDDLSHVDLKSHVPYSTEEVQKAPERAIERLKRNHKIKKCKILQKGDASCIETWPKISCRRASKHHGSCTFLRKAAPPWSMLVAVTRGSASSPAPAPAPGALIL